ncbi:MAG: hypothetical protein NWE83_14120 [Candidatus Bathyarchaeota archaeon]|nr:hypothetical protein [Candidatus Bathyarchaeota archaeon]
MDVQTATVVIAGIGVIICVINSIIFSRRAEKNDQQMLETRQAQLFTQVYDRWSSRDAVKAYGLVRYKYQWSDYDDWFRKYGPDVDIEAYADYGTLLTFFEGLGVLVKKGLIDISLVEDLLANRIIWFWETHMEPTVDTTRSFTRDPLQ